MTPRTIGHSIRPQSRRQRVSSERPVFAWPTHLRPVLPPSTKKASTSIRVILTALMPAPRAAMAASTRSSPVACLATRRTTAIQSSHEFRSDQHRLWRDSQPRRVYRVVGQASSVRVGVGTRGRAEQCRRLLRAGNQFDVDELETDNDIPVTFMNCSPNLPDTVRQGSATTTPRASRTSSATTRSRSRRSSTRSTARLTTRLAPLMPNILGMNFQAVASARNSSTRMVIRGRAIA